MVVAAYQLGNTSSRTKLRLVRTWMKDRFSVVANPSSRLDLISRPILVVGSVLMQI